VYCRERTVLVLESKMVTGDPEVGLVCVSGHVEGLAGQDLDSLDGRGLAELRSVVDAGRRGSSSRSPCSELTLLTHAHVSLPTMASQQFMGVYNPASRFCDSERRSDFPCARQGGLMVAIGGRAAFGMRCVWRL
jgi:hypothetical protein